MTVYVLISIIILGSKINKIPENWENVINFPNSFVIYVFKYIVSEI